MYRLNKKIGKSNQFTFFPHCYREYKHYDDTYIYSSGFPGIPHKENNRH